MLWDLIWREIAAKACKFVRSTTSKVFSFFPLIFYLFICSTCIARFRSRSCSTHKTSWSSIESGEFSSHRTDEEIQIEKCISVLDLFTRSHCIVAIIKMSLIFFTSSVIVIYSFFIMTFWYLCLHVSLFCPYCTGVRILSEEMFI